MENDFFDRQYRLMAGVAGAVGFTVGEPTSPHNTPLHISFSVERTDSQTLNTSKISLWNLSEKHINTLMKDGCQLILNAGYGNGRPCIFKGTVTNVVTELDGADRETQIEAVDGFAELKDTYICLSFKGRVNAQTLIETCAEYLGMSVVYSTTARVEASRKYLASGYSSVGSASTALTKACTLAGLKWTIQNGVLQVQKNGENIATVVHTLSPETGLIGVPKKIYNSAVASGEDTGSSLQDSLFGYEVVYFMNGNINVNDLVKLESRIVTGVFRVYKLQIDGDNLAGDWQCTAQLVEVTSA